MTKLNLEQMEVDRKAGTQGKWVTGPYSEMQVRSNAEPSSVCSTGGWSDPRIDADVQQDMQLANARRIARVPQLEAMVSDMAEALRAMVSALSENLQDTEPFFFEIADVFGIESVEYEEVEKVREEQKVELNKARAVLAKHVGEA